MMKLHRRPTRHNSGFTITEAAELLANVMRVKAERDRAVEDLDQLRRQHLDLLAQAQQRGPAREGGEVMSDGFPRFNVMPKRPLSVEDTGENNEWWSGRLGYLPKDHWHEVPEPIVWDGSEEALDEIRRALGHGDGDRGVYRDYEGWLEIEDSHTHEYLGFVAHNARIQIAGDSFAILPPEKDGDA